MNRSQLVAVVVAALACGGVRAAPVFSDNFDANALGLNAVPAGWSLVSGAVDIIGVGGVFDLIPGHGHYIDLDGSVFKGGKIRRGFDLVAGLTYTASFDLAGNMRGAGDDRVKVDFGSAHLDLVLGEVDALSTWTMSFTPTVSGSYDLAFKNDGKDNMGALLDNVAVSVAPAAAPTAVPEPQSLVLAASALLALGVVSSRRRRPARQPGIFSRQ